jgi:hypothetical protein
MSQLCENLRDKNFPKSAKIGKNRKSCGNSDLMFLQPISKKVDQGSPLKSGISHHNFIEKCVQQGKARFGEKAQHTR